MPLPASSRSFVGSAYRPFRTFAFAGIIAFCRVAGIRAGVADIVAGLVCGRGRSGNFSGLFGAGYILAFRAGLCVIFVRNKASVFQFAGIAGICLFAQY